MYSRQVKEIIRLDFFFNFGPEFQNEPKIQFSLTMGLKPWANVQANNLLYTSIRHGAIAFTEISIISFGLVSSTLMPTYDCVLEGNYTKTMI